MKKFIALLLCAFLFITVFAGCGKKDGGDASGTDAVAADVSFLDENGESKYNIIRPSDGSEEVSKSATSVYSTLKKQLGISPKNIDDSEDGTDKWEILIGNTNRPETKTAMEMLVSEVGGRYNDYIICNIDKKIVILGVTDAATFEAAKYFTSNYATSAVITGGIKYFNKTEGSFSEITVAGNNIQKYNIIRPHYNASYIMTVEFDKLTSMIKSKSGFLLGVKEDRYEAESEYEIVVGNTNRPGTPAVSDYDEYVIKVEGNKVYINGGSYYATAIAISEFYKMLESGSVTTANNVTGDYFEALENYDTASRLNFSWRDEFEGNSVDLNKWNFFGPGQSDSPGVGGKLSIRSNDPAVSYVYDGKFTIAATYDDKYFYGGMLRSHNNKTNYLYGFIEMSAIIPDGDGLWITLWMCSETSEGAWSPEIDVDECYGNAVKVEGNYHSWPTTLGKSMGLEHKCYLHGGYNIPTRPEDDEHFGLNFHTYGFMWTPEWIGGTVDGNLYQKFDTTEDPIYVDTFNDTMYLIISLANNFANCPLSGNTSEYEWENTNKLIVESIYIYQYFDGKSMINGKPAGVPVL